MKAATYVSAGNLQLIDQPKPVIKKPTDAIVRVSENDHLWNRSPYFGW